MSNKIPYSLSKGKKLKNYTIVSSIGSGGFSIVYKVKNEQGEVFAAKEYLPASIATRELETQQIELINEKNSELFKLGLESFLKEIELLKNISHPSIIQIIESWEENGTGYIISPLYEGDTLKKIVRKNNEIVNERWIKSILIPLLDALEELHENKIYHRDISPDNIIIKTDGSPVLLDLGSARNISKEDENTDSTIILKPGYAPIEQYSDNRATPQGPWSDVYSMAAVIYFMVTGKAPTAAISRIIKDTLEPLKLEKYPAYSDAFLQGINKSLSLNISERPQTVTALKELLELDITVIYNPLLNNKNPITIKESSEQKNIENTYISEKIHKKQNNGLNHPNKINTLNNNNENKIIKTSIVIAALIIIAGVFSLQTDTSKTSQSVTEEGSETHQKVAQSQRQKDDLLTPSNTFSEQSEANEYNAQIITIEPAALAAQKNKIEPKGAELPVLKEEQTVTDQAEQPEVILKTLGRLKIAASSNGKFWINNESAGDISANGDIQLPVGEYTIKMTSQGKKDYSQKVIIKHDQTLEIKHDFIANTPIKKTIAAIKKPENEVEAELSINVIPWGEVWVDGKKVGVSPPLTRVKLSKGTHRIEIINSSYSNYKRQIKVDKKSTIKIHHNFTLNNSGGK